MDIKTAYNTKKYKGKIFDESIKKCKSKTQQQFEKECNVNNIIARFKKTGVLGDPMRVAMRQAVFGDFSQVDFQTNLNKITAVKSEFERLPVEVKAKFANNPANMLGFMSDPKNLEESVKLGLLPKSMLPEPAHEPRNYENKEDKDKAKVEKPA